MCYSQYFRYVEYYSNDAFELLKSTDNPNDIQVIQSFITHEGVEYFSDTKDEIIKHEVTNRLLTPDPKKFHNFIEYHFQEYCKDPDNQGDFFITFLEEQIPGIEIPDKRKESLKTWILSKRKKIPEGPRPDELPEIILKKIQWKGSPSQMGYLFIELLKHGFIDPPSYGGQSNMTGLAKLVFKYFDTGTTLENLIKEFNEGKNSLSDTKRAKFTIPDISDIA